MGKIKKLFVSDIDNTLLGDDKALSELKKILENTDFPLGVGVASGRTVNSALEILKDNNFPYPDFIISSVGSEIYMKQNGRLLYKGSKDWRKYLDEGWKRHRIEKVLSDLDNIKLQDASEQGDHKISYHINTDTDLNEIKKRLNLLKRKTKLIVSKNKDMDILPVKSGKGNAIKFIAERLNMPMDSIFVAGDSGNDEDMLTIGALSVVVGNYSGELEKLKGNERIFFAEREYAGGIIEGMKHFNFINS